MGRIKVRPIYLLSKREYNVTMESNKRTLLKTASWETFHLVGVAGVIYLFTGEWEYASLGALIYIGWEAIGYFLHERVWVRFGSKIQ